MPKKPSVPLSDQDSAPPQESAQQIWLAGLGAFAQAQQQGGQVFKTLVQDGLAMQRKTQEAARAQMAQASEKLSTLAAGLGTRVGQPWDRLEGIFEERVARALQRLDMASRQELEALRERIEVLEAQVRQLQTRSVPSQDSASRDRVHPSAKATAAAKRPRRSG